MMRRNWAEQAKAAIEDLQRFGHGERERQMQAIALRLSGHNDTSALRRAIFAYQFLDRLRSENPAVHEILKDAPLTIVEVIARWSAFDPWTAMSVARDWAKGIGNVRSIAKAMQAARPPGFMGKTGNAFAKAFLAAAEPVVTEAVRSLASDQKISPKKKEIKDPASGQPIDFLFEKKAERTENGRTIAVLVVGPYTNKKVYANRCSEWVIKAFGLAWLYDELVIALPDRGSLDEYIQRVKATTEGSLRHPAGPASDAAIRSPRVSVIHIEVDPLEAADHDALAEIAARDAQS